MRALRIGLAQINPTVGDLAANARLIIDRIAQARAAGVDLLVFPELALTGYPPEDLVLRPTFIADVRLALDEIVPTTKGMTVMVGCVDRTEAGLHNAAAICHDGALVAVYHKHRLPNYGVFDEKRYFIPGTRPCVFVTQGVAIGPSICEDIWDADGPCVEQVRAGGAEVIVNLSASPYHAGKWREREAMLAGRATEHGVWVCYVNMIGGQDELVFDGHSLVMDARGRVVARGRQFEEDLVYVDLVLDGPLRQGDARRMILPPIVRPVAPKNHPKPPRPTRPGPEAPQTPESEVYDALVLGTKDYCRKNGFESAVVGVSGGIDSALTTAIAVDALGKDRVLGLFMPSAYTSTESEEEVQELVTRLGIRLITLPIQALFETYLAGLFEAFQGRQADTTEENLQARIRGTLLMAVSNKFGALVLTTGNKSEMSTGYATLYGDMAGGLAVIKDVPKTLVYALARYRNTLPEPVFAPRVLTRPPTAELRPGQFDTDNLPPYEILDPILQAYIEEHRSIHEIETLGYDPAMIRRVVEMVERSEYKRRQAPPGIKITQRAFGKDRRVPITHRYRSR